MILATIIVGMIVFGTLTTSVLIHDDSDSNRSLDQDRGEGGTDNVFLPSLLPEQARPSGSTAIMSESYADGEISYSLTRTYADGRKVGFQQGPTGSHVRDTRSDSDFHPLSVPITELVHLDEIAIGNFRKTNEGTMWVFDDTYQHIKNIHTGKFDAENLGGSDMAAGDFDGDGRFELVISSQLDDVRDDVPTNVTLVSFFDDASHDFELLNTSVFWVTSCSLAAGDLDGDGIDEVAMVGNYHDEGSMAGVVFDDLLAPEHVLHLWDPIDHGWEVDPDPTIHHDMTAGDFDGDGRDEIATVGYYNDTLTSWVWSMKEHPEGPIPVFDGMDLVTTLPEMRFTKGQPSLATGDIDGDGRDELIVTTHDADWKLHYRIYDDSLTQFGILRDVRENITIRSTDSATGDIDGDGLDEIFLVGHQVAHLVGRVLDDANHDYAVLKVLDYVPEDPWFYWFNVKVQTGDVDGDGYDEYAILGQSYIYLYGELHDDLGPGNNQLLNYWKIGDNKLPTMAIGDFDGDGLILEYTGERTSFVTPGIPFAAMAAPPVIEGVNQDPDGSFTRFGTSKAEGIEGGYQLTISAELSFSFEGEPIGMPEGVRSAFLNEFSSTGTPIRITTTNISFESHYPDDHVLSQSSEFDQYTYRILSWPGHDDRIGENISINVPMAVTVEYSTRAEFNAHPGSSQHVGPEALHHQSGDIPTYPDSEERNVTLSTYSGWSSETVRVERGNGMAPVFIDLSEGLVHESMLSFGSRWNHLDGIPHGYTSTAGLTSDRIHHVTIGENTRFEGSVGYLADTGDPGAPGEPHYSYGMFVYVYDPSGEGLEYLVINYWAEGNGEPRPVPGEPDGHWAFDSLMNSNLTPDLSTHHHHAHVKGATLTNGVKERALSFDGIDDEVEISFALSPYYVSIELWLRTTMIDTGMFSIPGNSDSPEVQDYDFQLIDGFPHIEIPYAEALTADAFLADGLWHYWVWTMTNRGAQKLYIDGELVGEHSPGGSAFHLADRIVIGYSSSSSQPHFKGSIDEVKVHQRVLIASEVDENYTIMGYDPTEDIGRDTGDDTDDAEYWTALFILFVIIANASLVTLFLWKNQI